MDLYAGIYNVSSIRTPSPHYSHTYQGIIGSHIMHDGSWRYYSR